MIPSSANTAQSWEIRRYGHHGFLVIPTTSDVLDALTALDHYFKNTPANDLIEWVIGYDSALLLFHKPTEERIVFSLLKDVPFLSSDVAESSKIHRIEVCYDGPDLVEVATASGLDIDEIIHRHCTPTYRVRFLGFAPGFAYLDGLDPSLHLPRRATPRPRMNAGAVAIGGAHAGIYSVPTPGGWNWLGNTQHPLFQPNSTNPFTLAPGDCVQFVAEA